MDEDKLTKIQDDAWQDVFDTCVKNKDIQGLWSFITTYRALEGSASGIFDLEAVLGLDFPRFMHAAMVSTGYSFIFTECHGEQAIQICAHLIHENPTNDKLFAECCAFLECNSANTVSCNAWDYLDRTVFDGPMFAIKGGIFSYEEGIKPGIDRHMFFLYYSLWIYKCGDYEDFIEDESTPFHMLDGALSLVDDYTDQDTEWNGRTFATFLANHYKMPDPTPSIVTRSLYDNKVDDVVLMIVIIGMKYYETQDPTLKPFDLF